MRIEDHDLRLAWERDLFVWEGARIARLRHSPDFVNMAETLLAEALVDAEVASKLTEPEHGVRIVDPATEAHRVLTELLRDPTLTPRYEAPRYWLERQHGITAKAGKPLAVAFAELVHELQDHDYFPGLLPQVCVDGHRFFSEIDPSEKISKSIHAPVKWEPVAQRFSVDNETLFAIIEFFHDHAQRPRTRWFHSYSECGWHYGEHNRVSGAVVYRWRVNEMLDAYDIPYRLGSKGPETGRLIQHAELSLDALSDETAELPPDASTDDEKIAAAIRLYRQRASGTHDRRAAVAQLAGFLEKYRQELKGVQFTRGDESDLFNIFNNFSIRHDNARQKNDYGDEYLDWVFWTTLAAIQLVRSRVQRDS